VDFNQGDPNIPASTINTIAGHSITLQNVDVELKTEQGGTIFISSGGGYNYYPPANFIGTDYHIYQICDNYNPSLCADAFLTIVITPVNDPPIAKSNNDETNENIPLVMNDPDFGLLPNDIDRDDELQATPITTMTKQGGFITVYTDGTYKYYPPIGFAGDDEYEYTVSEKARTTPQFATATLFLTVHPLNNPPIAVNDETETSEDTPVTGVTVLYNDDDPDGDNLSINTTPIEPTRNGSVVIHPDGTYTYTPNEHYNGKDEFVYETCDPQGLCARATVVITIHPINDPPIAYDDVYSTPEDQTLTVPVGTGILKQNGVAGITDPSTDDYDPDANYGVTPNDDVGHIKVSSVTNATTHFGGKISIGTDGNFTYTPVAGFTGVDFYKYEICDTQTPEECTEATVFITVTLTLDEIYARNDVDFTKKNQTITSGLKSLFANDYDPENTPLATDGNTTLTSQTTTEGGKITINPDGTYSYEPKTDFVGVDTYTYTVRDKTGTGQTTTAVLTIYVNDDANRPPVALDDNRKTLRNIPIDGTVIHNDSDPDGDFITVTLTVSPFTTTTENGGTITVRKDGTYDYVPAHNFVGNDFQPYQVCDPFASCAEATLFITVQHENRPPKPINDYYYTNQNAFLTGTVKPNDADPDFADTYPVLHIQPSANDFTTFGGFISIGADGAFNYRPQEGFTGVDKYVYKICDDENPDACTEAVLFISVIPTNQAPVAVNDITFTTVNQVINENGSFRGTLKQNDFDPEGDPITVTAKTDVTTDNGGKITINVDGTYVYTPPVGFIGTDTYDYQICDDKGLCSRAKLTIVIGNQNDPPIAINDKNTTNEDTPITVNDGDGNRLIINDNDPNIPAGSKNIVGHSISISYTDHTAFLTSGTAQLTEQGGFITITNSTTGAYEYTPPKGFNGTDFYVYKLCDNLGLCTEAFLTITINSVNSRPYARDDWDETNEDTPLIVSNPNFGVKPNDFDSESDITVTAVSGVPTTKGGFITVNVDGTYKYYPPAGFAGDDEYEYEVCEVPSGLCDKATLFITVHPVNDLPNANNDYIATSEDTPITGRDIRLNDTDPEGGTLIVNTTPIVPPRHGSVVINSDGTYVYTPNPNYNGKDEFVYEVCEVDKDCAIATVVIDIYPVNDPPIAYDDINQTPENTVLEVTSVADGILGDVDGAPVVGENSNSNSDDHDPDGANTNDSDITVSPVLAGVTKYGGAIFISANGTYNYTPINGFNGVDEFIYEICDVQNPEQCTNATLFITVTPVNDPLVAINDYGSTSINTPFDSEQSMFANDYDPEGRYALHSNSLITVTVTTTKGGTLKIAPNGNYNYSPPNGFTGTDTYEYKVYDQDNQFTSAVLTIYIGDVSNRPPQANPDRRQTTEDMPVTGQVANNDSDPNARPLAVTKKILDTTSNGGKITIDKDGNYTYYPPKNFTGNDTYVYEICQTTAPNLCSESVIFLTVVPWNDAPAPLDENIITNVNAPISGNVKTNDSDPDDEFAVLKINAVTDVETVWGGKISIDIDGNYTYTPPKGFTGNDKYIYTICDDHLPFASCREATIFVTVQPKNNPPVAQNDFAFTPINTPVTGAVSAIANDFDPDDDHIVITSVADAPTANGGRITINANGVYTYTPPHGFEGVDVYEYTICETGIPNPKCVTAKITINVSGKQPPIALADNNSTQEDTAVSGTTGNGKDAKRNDSDPDTPFANLTITAKTDDVTEKGGKITIGTDGQYTYTPPANFTGNDTYVYKICDTDNLCAEAIIYITVTPVVDIPIANDDYDKTFKNVPLVVNDPYFGVLRNDYHNEHRPLTVTPFTSVKTSNGGTLTMFPDGTYTYISDPFFVGLDQYDYEVCDNQTPKRCANATLFITVIELLNAPIMGGEAIFVGQDIPYTESTSLLSNDKDPEGRGLTINTNPVVNPRHGTLTINPDGTYKYVPNPGYYGEDSFVYRVCDADGDCSTATVTILVNAKPLVEDDKNVTSEDKEVTGTVMPNDKDPDKNNLTAEVKTNPKNGTVVLKSNGEYVYTPNAGFYGDDEFTYTICDDGKPVMCSEEATVRIYVNGKPDLVPDNANVGQDHVLIGKTILANDSEPNGHGLVLNTNPIISVKNGTLVINPDGTYTYTPNEGFYGNDSFTYEVCDDFTEAVACDFTTVFITVNGKPIAIDDQEITLQGTPVTSKLPILTNDSDPDGHNLFLTTTPVENPKNGSVVINPDGIYTYTPNPDFHGIDQFVYQICDDGIPSLCDFATVFITVNGGIVAQNDYFKTEENIPVSGSLAGNDSDVDGGILTFTTVPLQNPTNGAVVLNSDGTFTYTPNDGFFGVDSFVYEVCDDDTPKSCTSATAFISIPKTANVDTDTDKDGIPDEIEGNKDTDGDGIPDFQDPDADNDIIPDNIEAGNDPSNPIDTDLDGKPDYQDEDSDNDGISDNVEAGNDPSNPNDTDNDGIPDFQDRDSDNDKIPDYLEVGNDPANPIDTDNDGIPDYQDIDSDNDGIIDDVEVGNDPLNPTDTDGDGIPDFRDLDTDGDGIPDNIEAQNTETGLLEDTDGDGIPDFQDPDSDNDGIPDEVENSDANNLRDSDSDGLLDHLDTDSDNDGISDTIEAGVDGEHPVDTDNDGIRDYLDPDSDNDGIPDYIEGTVDSDKDGKADYVDLDSDNDNIPDGVEVGEDPLNPVDSDGDGIEDFRDPIELIIWEGISPNNDGDNDSWIIDGIRRYPNNRVRIFNRWGNLVYSAEGYNNENVIWYGQSNQGITMGEEILPDGTYYYVIDLDGDSNKIEPIGGYVILNR